MKKQFFILAFLLVPLFSIAQNYQCLQSGVNRYFTNELYYLRGMRIDSVRQQGDTTIYYPYHTARGPYLANPYEPVLDSTGSSWLGKKVLQYPDGTFMFNNMFDTVFIKTQANVGDSWTFYNDTTQDYYTATVTGINIASVLDSTDTVKTITLTSYHGTAINTADSLNGFEILLSKNHGFVQVFDLYTFPYHEPDTAYYQGLDYYLDESIANNNYPLGTNNENIFNPAKINAVFRLSLFVNPTQIQLHNWEPGDVYEHTSTPDFSSDYTNGFPNEYNVDSIMSKQFYNDSVTYFYKHQASDLYLINQNQGLSYANVAYSTTSTYDAVTYSSATLFSSEFMPEEYHDPNIYYYVQTDTGNCLQSPLYSYISGDIHDNNYFPPFEGPFVSTKYKLGLGLVYYEHSYEDDIEYIGENNLIYAYRNGISCGNYRNLAVTEIARKNKVVIFPNPANTELNIRTDLNGYTTCKMVLANMLGEVVCTINSDKQDNIINVSNLPSGIYLLSLTDKMGLITNQKVTVSH